MFGQKQGTDSKKKDGIVNSWESPENLCASISVSMECSHIGLLSTNEEQINAGF